MSGDTSLYEQQNKNNQHIKNWVKAHTHLLRPSSAIQ